MRIRGNEARTTIVNDVSNWFLSYSSKVAALTGSKYCIHAFAGTYDTYLSKWSILAHTIIIMIIYLPKRRRPDFVYPISIFYTQISLSLSLSLSLSIYLSISHGFSTRACKYTMPSYAYQYAIVPYLVEYRRYKICALEHIQIVYLDGQEWMMRLDNVTADGYSMSR